MVSDRLAELEEQMIAARRKVVSALHSMHIDRTILVSKSLSEELDRAWDAYDAAVIAHARERDR
jgi:hypothetical protein